VITALDLISWPFAFVAVAALAPFQWLIVLNPSSRRPPRA